MLALAQPAEATIVYTRTHDVLHSGDFYYLDLNHDGVTDFVFADFNNYCSDLCQAALNVEGEPLNSNGIEGKQEQNSAFYANALRGGAQISHTRTFGFRGATMVGVFSNGSRSTTRGYWDDVRNRYLGLKFVVNGKTHYGWARWNVMIHGQGRLRYITATLTGYAYETIPNKPIIAGKTHGGASLGALAAGASAIPAWRGAN